MYCVCLYQFFFVNTSFICSAYVYIYVCLGFRTSIGIMHIIQNFYMYYVRVYMHYLYYLPYVFYVYVYSIHISILYILSVFICICIFCIICLRILCVYSMRILCIFYMYACLHLCVFLGVSYIFYVCYMHFDGFFMHFILYVFNLCLFCLYRLCLFVFSCVFILLFLCLNIIYILSECYMSYRYFLCVDTSLCLCNFSSHILCSFMFFFFIYVYA